MKKITTYYKLINKGCENKAFKAPNKSPPPCMQPQLRFMFLPFTVYFVLKL